MDGCGLSSTGVKNVDANDITTDNITIFSFLNVSGFSNFNEVIVHNNATLLSSLNNSGFTILNNGTTLLSSINASGLTVLNNDVSPNNKDITR